MQVRYTTVDTIRSAIRLMTQDAAAVFYDAMREVADAGEPLYIRSESNVRTQWFVIDITDRQMRFKDVSRLTMPSYTSLLARPWARSSELSLTIRL